MNGFRRRDRICSLYVFLGDRTAWGKGYGRDAIMTLLGWAFDRLDLYQIELWSLASNERAIATYERTVLSGNSIHDRADLAMPRRQATPAQLAALGKAMAARRTCPACQAEYEDLVPVVGWLALLTPC